MHSKVESIIDAWHIFKSLKSLKILGENDKNIKLRKIWGVVLVGSIYRSPLSSVVHFIDKLEDILQFINLNFIEQTVVLAGDVNINYLLAYCRNGLVLKVYANNSHSL